MLTFPTWSAPVVLLVICFAAYGWQTMRLGFFWDDWFYAYHIHFFGSEGFQQAFLEDRPFAGGLYQLTGNLFGESPVSWQIFALFTRWLTCIAFWWSLYGLWPGKQRQVTAAAFLFAVYPGFKQQHIAILYSNWFIILAFFLFSLGAMIWAVRIGYPSNPGKSGKSGLDRKYFWFLSLYSLSLITSGYSMFVMEYFFGLELLRPILLWITLGTPFPGHRSRIRKTIEYWIPYAVLSLVFLIWRSSYISARGHISVFERILTSPIATLLDSLKVLSRNVYWTGILAWLKAFDFSIISGYDIILIIRFVLILLACTVFVTFYLSRLRHRTPIFSHSELLNTGNAKNKVPEYYQNSKEWGIQAILLGLYTLVIAGIPFWVTNLPVSLHFPRDRFTLSFIFGASLLLVGFFEILPRIFKFQEFIFSGLSVGLGVGVHYQSALTYRQEWLNQKQFFWQLAWRAPALEKGTIILTTEVPFPYDTDNSLAAPLNWIYNPENISSDLQYYYYNVESHYSRKKPPLTENTPLDIYWRTAHFNGSLAKALFVLFQPGSCLKVIDPSIDRSLPDKPRFFREASRLSQPGLIIGDPVIGATPPLEIFGREPAQDWCYFYEKADLAAQNGSWEQVAQLGDKALAGKKFYRKNASETIPFIRGYAFTDQWQKAEKLTSEAFVAWANMRTMLCEVWQEILTNHPNQEQAQQSFTMLQGELQCKTKTQNQVVSVISQ